MPTAIQAGAYSAVMHYLKAVEAIKSTDGRAVVDQMKKMPGKDDLFGAGIVRQDGRYLHDCSRSWLRSPRN